MKDWITVLNASCSLYHCLYQSSMLFAIVSLVVIKHGGKTCFGQQNVSERGMPWQTFLFLSRLSPYQSLNKEDEGCREQALCRLTTWGRIAQLFVSWRDLDLWITWSRLLKHIFIAFYISKKVFFSFAYRSNHFSDSASCLLQPLCVPRKKKFFLTNKPSYQNHISSSR